MTNDDQQIPQPPPPPTIPIASIIHEYPTIEDPVHVINLMFPTEQSFTQLEVFEQKLSVKRQQLDGEIRQLLQPVDYSQNLQLMETSIIALKKQIVDIKQKAQHAESTVQYITKDIKSLDQAKKNLTSSILFLKKLSMLASGLDQLRLEMQRRNYKEMPSLLEAVLQLSTQFIGYKNIPQVADLLENVTTCQAEIKRMIFSAFEGGFTTQGVFTGNATTLNEACQAINVMEETANKQLMDWYCDLQLRDYRAIFRNNDEVGNLENVARRYAWLKRLCKTYDEEQATIFPTEWQVSKLICERFCTLTKDDIAALLIRGSSGANNIDVKLLVKSLQVTLEFEAGLNRRFLLINNPKAVNTLVESQELPKEYRLFDGLVSSAFEPYLRLYVEMEDKSIRELLDKFRSKTIIQNEDLSTGVFTASTDLFLFYRQTLVSMAKLNNRRPFVELSKSFSKGLATFCEILQSKIPKEDKRSLSSEDIKFTCLILNTAEYCQSTTTQLEEKIKEKIDAEFRDLIDMSREHDQFLMLITTSIQSMVKLVMSTLSQSFVTMVKLHWSSMQNVGDQSEYVSQINVTLKAQISVIRSIVQSQGGSGVNTSGSKQFRWFCDKFVDHFVPVFLKNIHSCKPISEIGAEQLLLDTHAVKTILLELPNLGAETKVPPSSVYTKFVIKSMSKAETLLKVVLTHLDPPDMIIKNYMILCADGAEEEIKNGGFTRARFNELRDGFAKILELKGLKESEQAPLIDLLQQHLGVKANHNMLPPLVNVLGSTQALSSAGLNQSQYASIQQSNSGLSSIASGFASIQLKSVGSSVSDAGLKLNENFKKVAGMSWLKRDASAAPIQQSSPEKKK